MVVVVVVIGALALCEVPASVLAKPLSGGGGSTLVAEALSRGGRSALGGGHCQGYK